jgi:NitT/TauT family transport system substrate-binding protein
MAAASTFWGARAAVAADRIRVSFASDSAVYGPHFIAMERGYYAEEGIDMELVRAGGGVATPALISGELQYSTSAASSLSAILKGAALKVIYTNADRPGYELWSSSPDIKTLTDLKGKSIGIQTRGDTMEISVRMVLAKHGIDPNSVSYTPLGYGATRLAAIRSGAIPSAILGISDTVQLKDSIAKGHRLANIRKEIQMLYTGVATSERELSARRNRAERFLRATIKGREYFKAFKDETLKILMKYNKDPRDANEVDYQDVLTAMTEDGSMPKEVQQRDAQFRAEVIRVPKDRIRPVEEMYDYSLVKEIYRALKAAGWKPQK